MFAAAQKLDNVCVDRRLQQVAGDRRAPTRRWRSRRWRDKWAAFGWDAREIDGHDVGALAAPMRAVPNGSGKPVAIDRAHRQGKGVSFMEDDNNWHYRIPTADEVARARRELGLA